jgi:hypothetical protein
MRLLASSSSPTLERFVRELEAQSPEPLEALAPSLDGVSDEVRYAAKMGWASRVVDEYRSAARFTVLLSDLLEIEAPFELLAATQRLIGDELRHARSCARFAACFGSMDGVHVELDDLGWKGRVRPPKERALEIVVRELVIGEGESLACMRAYLRASTDPAALRVQEALLQDEARHFATGQHMEAVLLATFPELSSFHEDLEPTLLDDVRLIRGAHRDGARGGPGRAFGVSIELYEAPPAIED